MFTRFVVGTALVVGLAILTVIPAAAAQSLHAKRVIDENDRVALHGNVHPLACAENDVGPTDPSLPMERMILTMRRSPAKQAILDQFIAKQHDRSSMHYHRWLTPEEFGKKFGALSDDIDTVTGWLTSHGFTVNGVGKGRTSIEFSGKAYHVERAFHVKMRDYKVNGHVRHGNAQDPTFPRALSDLVAGVVSLHNFPINAINAGTSSVKIQPNYTASDGSHYLTPGDFATIYHVNPLYNEGIDGSNQAIAIVGRSNPSTLVSDWHAFRSIFGLPNTLLQVIIVNEDDPGDNGDNLEAALDIQWAGAIAKNATINFVTARSTSTDGVLRSAEFIVDYNLAPVMSISYGKCENDLGNSANNFINDLWAQAAAQGITVFVSTGDTGAAGCVTPDSNGNIVSWSLGVNGFASTPYNVAVGGTQFDEMGYDSVFWNIANGSDLTSANYRPNEIGWNESGTMPGGSGPWASGGGGSIRYGKPAWQNGQGVPADGMRDIPDVSLSAASHDPYLVVTNGQLAAVAGTSAGAPAFAGIMALVDQQTGQRQGNANTRFYQLPNMSNSGPSGVFYDIQVGNNSVPGVSGYSCMSGYNLVTGLGSVNVNNLVAQFSPPQRCPAGLTYGLNDYPCGAYFDPCPDANYPNVDIDLCFDVDWNNSEPAEGCPQGSTFNNNGMCVGPALW